MSVLQVTISFLFFVQFAIAQTGYRIATGEGLLTNMLTTVIKDRNNYMWVGSYNGLHKHEGSRIKTYKRTGKDSAAISSSEMHGLFEDRLGYIWIGTTAGLDKLDPVTGRIIYFFSAMFRPLSNVAYNISYLQTPNATSPLGDVAAK